MALSRELINRLDSNEEPLQKRLKLAHNALFAIDLPIIRKEDLILQWLCKICTIEDNAWSFLQCCLKSGDINIKGNIKKLLIDVLVNKLSNDSSNVCNEVLECCNLLLSNAGMQQYFSNKPQDLELLLKSLINYAHSSVGNHLQGININIIEDVNKSIALIYNTIIIVLENLIQIYKQSVNTKDEISTIFIHEVLYPLCSMIDYKHKDSTNRLGATMHKCIHQLIFVKNKHLQDVPDEIHKTILSELFSELANNAKTRNLQSNLSVFVSTFRVAISVYKSNNIMLDIIFRRLINSAGKYKKELLISFFDYFGDTSFDFENKIDNITLLQFFEEIIDDVLSVETLSSVDYKILTMTAYFNPLLIEKKIDNIICKLYMQKSTAEHDDLLIGILNASILLRQEHELIKQLLTPLQQVTTSESKSDLKVQSFFPLEFRKKFTKSVGSITNAQTLTMFKILIDHLHSSGMDSLESNTTYNSITMMTAVSELLTAFFKGIYIFGNTSTFTHQQDFINIFNESGKDLSLLITKALYHHNTNVIAILLSVLLSWCEIQNIIRYYLPKRINLEFIFPIANDDWQQLVQKIVNSDEKECRNNMNKLIIHRIKYSALNESSVKFDAWVGGLKHVWRCILTNNNEIISLLSDKDIAELVSLLVADMMLTEDKFYEWIKVISKENLQENRRFVIHLLCHVLAQIGTILKEGVTKSIIQHIDSKLILTTEIAGKKKIKKMLESAKEEMFECKLEQMENTALNLIKLYLSIIIHIPLTYFKTDVRALLLIIIHAINKESTGNDDTQSLCNKIFIKLFQTTGLDILQYLDPMSIVYQLPQYKAFPKALEQSLRNIKSYDILRALINSSATHKKSMYILLQCIENVKQKLDTDQKSIFKKAEKKLCKKLFSLLPTKIDLPYDVKCLTLILKITILNKEMENTIKKCAQTTLHEIFSAPDELDLLYSNELMDTGLELSVIVFRNYKEFEISPQIIKRIWSIMLKYPCEDLLLPFIECTEAQAIQDLLKVIHHQMMEELPKLDSSLLGSIFNVWNAILKSNMSAKRNKVRTAAIEHLCRNIEIVNISEQHWSKLLELLQNILNCKHLYTSNNIIDMSMNIALKALETETIAVCNDVLTLCGILIKVRMNIIVDRLPALLLLYRRVINITVQISKTCINKLEEHKCKCLLLDIEKFTNCLVKQKKDMIRLSPYIIADLVKILSEGGLQPFVKISLENTVATLIGICDQHGIALLSRTLPVSVQEVFKTQLDSFNKFHKFCGKI